LLFHGWCYAITVIVLLIIFAFQKIDDFGIIFGMAFLSFLAYKSYSSFRELKNTREEDKVFAPSADSTTADKILRGVVRADTHSL
jgi:glycerol kinase